MTAMSAVARAAALLTIAVLAGCSAGAHPAARHRSHALTATQGQRICEDLTGWLSTAENADRPRFSILLERDEKTAGATRLGQDLQILDGNLQQLNGVALLPSPPGYSPPTGLGALKADCGAYGVSIKLPAG